MSSIPPYFGTAAVMAARNPLVPKGITAGETDTGVIKVGDGATRYNSLSTALSGTYAQLADASSGAGNRVFYIGDSITAYSYNGGDVSAPVTNVFQSRSWPTYAHILSNGRVRYAGLSATAGYTMAQILATHVPVAVASDAHIVVVQGGRNDVLAPTAFATQVATEKLIYTAILAARKIPAITTMSATNSNTTAQALATAKINTWRREYAALYRLPLIDLAAATTDSATNNWVSGYYADASHPIAAGALAMGQRVITDLSTSGYLWPNTPPRPIAVTAGSGTDDPQIIANCLFTTDGNSDGIPDGISSNGSATYTAALSSASSDGILGNWFHTTRTGGSGSVAMRTTSAISVTAGHVYGFGFAIKTAGIVANTGSVFVRMYDDVTTTIKLGGLETWLGDISTAGRFYQEITIPVGTTSIRIDMGHKQGTSVDLYVGELYLADLTAAGSLT